MVINDFDAFCTRISPTKADTPLIVDADAVLTGTITLECFKVIAWRHPQIIKPTSNFDLPKFTPCNLGNACEVFDSMAL